MRSSFAIVAGLFLLSSSAVEAQTLIASQDFEGADLVGYSTLGGSFALNGADYFERGSNGSPFTFEQPVTGFSGSSFIGLEDIDGAGLVDPHWLALNPVTVTGYTSLSVSLLVAAPSLLATRYEEEDFLLVEYSLDGAGYTLLGRFVGSVGGGTLKHDTNLDGTGDVSIGAAMQRYTYSLGSARGSSLVVRVRFSSAGSQEELAFDDIRISGVPPVASTCGNGVVEGTEACDDGFTGGCGACNATCSGVGTGSTCGDGVVCAETEACDDGFKDSCGTCNAACSGAGTGSTCGDGVLCSQTETCDDGFKDACGACNATCSGAGAGSTCGDGVLCAQTETCDDGFSDACGACNATCNGPGTGLACSQAGSCDAGQACDAGSQGVVDACTGDCQGQIPDAGPGPGAQDAGPVVASDACSGACQGDQPSAEAGAISDSDACSENCSGAGQVSDAGIVDAGESQGDVDADDDGEGEDEEEEEDEDKEEDIDAVEAPAAADVDAGSAPRKSHGDGCSVAVAPTGSGVSPMMLLFAALLAVGAHRRFARR